MNEFLIKLLPFTSDKSIFLSYYILGMFLLFLLPLVGLLYNVVKMSKFTKYINSFSINEISKDNKLKLPWDRYYQTFITFDNGDTKTRHEAQEFFDISTFIDVRFLNTFPALLVGLGILELFGTIRYYCEVFLH